MKNFDKLSPESQEKVRKVAANLLTRHALKTGKPSPSKPKPRKS